MSTKINDTDVDVDSSSSEAASAEEALHRRRHRLPVGVVVGDVALDRDRRNGWVGPELQAVEVSVTEVNILKSNSR